MALSKPYAIHENLTDTVIACNWTEDLEANSDGLKQLFKPDDDPVYNCANHFIVKSARGLLAAGYTHHVITLGIKQFPQKIVLTVAHYTNVRPAGITGFLKTPVPELKIHELTVSIKKDTNGQVTYYIDDSDKDGSGSVVKDLLNGKASRVRNIYYPYDIEDRQQIVKRIQGMVGTASSNQASPVNVNDRYFIATMLLGYGISDQEKTTYLMAPMIEVVADHIPDIDIKNALSTVGKLLMRLPALIEKSETKEQLFNSLIEEFSPKWAKILRPAFSGVAKLAPETQMAVVGSVAFAAVEVIYLIFVTANDYWLLRKGTMTSRQFARNLLRNFTGSVGSATGASVGGFVGVLMPLPFGLNFLLGAAVGGLVGKYSGIAVGRQLEGGVLEEEIVQRLEKGRRQQLAITMSS